MSSSYLGDFRASKTVRFMWNSNAVAGESITRATNGTISVYKNASNAQSTSGVTDTEDVDGLTGVHRCEIDTSADGTFYAEGSDFMVVLSAATIDGKVINHVLAQFSLANRSSLRSTTADRTLNVNSGGDADANLVRILGTLLTETAGLIAAGFKKFFNVASPTGTVNSLPDAVPNNAAGLPLVNVLALASDIADANWDALRSAHTTPGTMGEGASQITSGVATGTPTPTTMAASALTSTQNDQYNTRLLMFTSGALIGVATTINDYTNTGRVFSFDAVPVAPSAGDSFIIL